MSSTDSISSLGCYILPGNSRSPQSAADQAAEAERLGLGTVWLGERFATKEAASVLGYLAGRTTRVRLATGTIMMQFRHPLALAGMCTTLQSLSSGRLDLGVSRSPGRPWSRLGLSPATTDYVEDYVAILKTLWSGEPVTYSGPVGHFSQMRLDFLPEVDRPRLLLAAVGPKALRLAGRCFDGVVLHGFLTPEAVARSRQIVRAAAVEAGRDPGTVRIYATVVVAPDKTEEEVDELVLMRAAQYLTNGPLVSSPDCGQRLGSRPPRRDVFIRADRCGTLRRNGPMAHHGR